MTTRSRKTPLALLAAFAAAVGVPAAASAADGGARPAVAEPGDAVALGTGAIAVSGRRPDLGARDGAPARDGFSIRDDGVGVPIAETLAMNLFVMGWNRWVGEARWANVSLDSVGRNLRSRWVLDDDAFWVNQFGHPYQGTWSFTAARSSGLGFWASAPFAFGASAMWELAGETERPSLNDQVTTTVAGVALGEVLFRFAGALRAEGGPWHDAVASVLSPMGALNSRLLVTAGTLAAPPSRWQLALGWADLGGSSRDPAGYAGFSFTYGVPGDPDLELLRPFDHFVLELGWATSADPAATVRARGLVAGETFDAGLARGVYGAFLSFDLDTPPRHRVSTSAIGFGSSASADLGGGFAVEGDAIASAVLLGAGGTVDRDVNGLGRDYRFGPGEQALLAVRVLAGSRASAGVSVRQYLLLGTGGDRGTELLVDGSASAAIRIAGAHGVGVEVSRYLRRAGTEGAIVRQADTAVRIYYTLFGGVAGPAASGSGAVAGSRAPPTRG